MSSLGFDPKADAVGCTKLDIQEILKIMPHRYPFLLVDRITELECGKRAVGIKNVTANDNFFTGHFPSRPIMPGVLMVEAMAQVSGILMKSVIEHKEHIGLFFAINNVKFRRTVTPGDTLVMEVEVIRDRKRVATTKGVARVDGEIACEAEMMFSFMPAEYLSL